MFLLYGEIENIVYRLEKYDYWIIRYDYIKLDYFKLLYVIRLKK